MSKRKRLIRRALILWLLSLMVVSPALAHSGSLDSNGGHWNHSTGTYHYHSGEHTEGSSGSSSGYSYSTGSYYATTGSVNLREGPSTDYRIITTLNPGVRVKYISSTQGWYRVNYNGQIGYVSGNYLEPTSAPVSYNKSVVSKSAVKAAATPTAKPVPTTAPTAKPLGKKIGNVVTTILCIIFFGPGVLWVLFLLGGMAVTLFLKITAWIIWRFAKNSYIPRTPAQEEEWRKKIRARRFLLYTPICGIAAISFQLFMFTQSEELNRIWLFVGFGIMFGVCWLIEHYLFPILAKWAKNFLEKS